MIDLHAEEQLFKRAQTSTEGFAELFDKCYDRIYRYAYRRVRAQQVAEDIAECVFEDALKAIGKAHWQGKPVIAWLFRITSRRIADHYRKQEPAILHDETDEFTDANTGDALDSSDRRIEVMTALARLNQADQEIIRLTFFDELEPSEISAVLGISKDSVYVRRHRALARLEAVLSAGGGSDGMESRGS